MNDATEMKAIIKGILDKVEIDMKRLKYLQELKDERLRMIKHGIVKLDGDVYRFYCPHCEIGAEVHTSQVACKIFRHAVLKGTHTPINPHCPKAQCEEYLAKGQVLGCAGPFEFIAIPDGYKVEICEYK